ncbi:hypothetical protein [Mycolicibacterium sediminis]|uniref:hypothetical protein n=1 Tax=Mycolicibacterium sediminis TaxID=1286180 RepID=UPI0013D06FD6|nr:hypothetical protein [Mycolicibacterium sediminis]
MVNVEHLGTPDADHASSLEPIRMTSPAAIRTADLAMNVSRTADVTGRRGGTDIGDAVVDGS